MKTFYSFRISQIRIIYKIELTLRSGFIAGLNLNLFWFWSIFNSIWSFITGTNRLKFKSMCVSREGVLYERNYVTHIGGVTFTIFLRIIFLQILFLVQSIDCVKSNIYNNILSIWLLRNKFLRTKKMSDIVSKSLIKLFSFTHYQWFTFIFPYRSFGSKLYH